MKPSQTQIVADRLELYGPLAQGNILWKPKAPNMGYRFTKGEKVAYEIPKEKPNPVELLRGEQGRSIGLVKRHGEAMLNCLRSEARHALPYAHRKGLGVQCNSLEAKRMIEGFSK